MKNIKPGQLIRLAIADLEKVEAKPETYLVNMGAWHETGKKRCHVCLAGCVMAMTLHVKPDQDRGPAHFPENVSQLSALNWFRTGGIDAGLQAMNIPRPSGCVELLPVTPYNIDPKRFKQDMIGIAEYLERRGL